MSAEAVKDTTLCDSCGHPRHVHVFCSDLYPALCSHAEPILSDPGRSNERSVDPMDGVCMCLEFEMPMPAAASGGGGTDA